MFPSDPFKNKLKNNDINNNNNNCCCSGTNTIIALPLQITRIIRERG